MRFRNPVEYLHNPEPEEVSADKLFSIVLRRSDRSMRHPGLVLWQKDGKWFVQQVENSLGKYADRGPEPRGFSTVSEALGDLAARFVPKAYEGNLVIEAGEEATIAALLQIILASLSAAPRPAHVPFKKALPPYCAVLVTHYLDPSYAADFKKFYVRLFLKLPEYSPYGNVEFLVEPNAIVARRDLQGTLTPFVGATLEEALTAAAAAVYGAGR